MAAISSTLSCICGSYSRYAISLPSSPDRCSLSFPSTPSHFPMIGSVVSSPSFLRRRTIMSTSAAVSEETLTPAEDDETPSTQTDEQTVSVPVSSSDILTMFFQAEGTMEEAALSVVGKALEEIGVRDLTVKILDGMASVELTKQTTVQATGVASNLVEVIQGSGFKLQTLNLSFEDEEDMD